MIVLHANWYDGAIRLWAESVDAFRSRCAIQPDDRRHDFALAVADLRRTLTDLPGFSSAWLGDDTVLKLTLPHDPVGPAPSERLAGLAGIAEPEHAHQPRPVQIEAVTVRQPAAVSALLTLESVADMSRVVPGGSLRYWIAVSRFVLELLIDQRFVPTVIQTSDHWLHGVWQPWLHDEQIRSRTESLLAAMPPVVRATEDDCDGQPWAILSEAINNMTDAVVRCTLLHERFEESLDELDPASDLNVAWLSGLLRQDDGIELPNGTRAELMRDVTRWIAQLDEARRDRPIRICFRLNEPVDAAVVDDDAIAFDAEDATWRLTIHVQSEDAPDALYDAEQVWSGSLTGLLAAADQYSHLQEFLLAELGRASRIYRRIEDALADSMPTELHLTTREAYEFLRDHGPVLEEAGFHVIAPRWWEEPASRLGARLQIVSDSAPARNGETNGRAEGAALGLNALVQYRWEIAVGEQVLTMEEFQQLTERSSPLVRVRGRWVEIRPDDLARAGEFLEAHPGGTIRLLDALQLASGINEARMGVPVVGLDASGWVEQMLSASVDEKCMPHVAQPQAFNGVLRPYQVFGLSWLAFLDRFGLGACLADDMGLGKTIQLIALLLHEREDRREQGPLGPTLLVVPTSVVGNWQRELRRFSPELEVHLQHGPDRPIGEAFRDAVVGADVVITTYALVSRDQDSLSSVEWRRVVLDEAQYIKNPPTKQTAAIRALRAGRRLALTGTPVENRLSELWSIMEFCNPGYLGSAAEFRKQFAIPIERHRDPDRAASLRRLVQPFVLRRLKTDPKVINDLPPCVETREYATLSREQASLYEATVRSMLEDVDRADGMVRRGRVLAMLVRLKQICNHPALVLEGKLPAAASSTNGMRPGNMASLAARSGKSRRLVELLEEVVASGEKALVFTQFRQMGHLLTTMIRTDLDCEALFLHGGTPSPRRQEMIDRFQDPHGGAPVFILSLKAGGLGLNLTAANHVFHFDRWWNPAVENQATDRAFRIGQTRSVHVHKFVCLGTLEERIDQMIEQKTELAENIIGSGEQWLTELSTGQLRELLALRRVAMETES